MVNDSDVAEGQVYELHLPEHEGAVLAEYREAIVESGAEPAFVFRQRVVNAPIVLEKSVFDQMRSDGTAIRMGKATAPRRPDDIDPVALLSVDDPNISVRERDRRVLARKRLQEARTLRFYCIEYDKVGNVGYGTVGVRNFISDVYAEAKAAGFDWKPSPGAVLRAVKYCGSPNERHLGHFYDQRGKHDRSERWPEDVLRLAGAVIAWYWAKRSRREIDALALFGRGCRLLAVRRTARGRPVTEDDPFERPHDQTLRLWIKASTNYWNFEQKFGPKEAQRRFGGRQRQITATEPLEMVMMDHTLIDVWSTVLDEFGNPVAVGRLWLTYAIDCYSRMILGAVFTYEHPSLNSVVECLRQVVRRKRFLIDEYGEHKGATDGYGKPLNVIVDNGWEFVGTSFQTSCEAANIDVIWAPVKIPMFKAYVERFFGTLNENIWHRLDGGLPLTPRDRSLLDIDPTVDAVHDRQRIQDIFWQYVVTRYHVEVHSGINSAPALKWRKGLAREGRPTIDDPGVLDTIMGVTQDCLLTAEGIMFRGQRFHEPAVTTQLMSELARYIKVRKQRKGVTSTRSIDVVATASAGNADQIFVWHPDKRQAVALPNWDPHYKPGTSWYLLRKIKEYAERENLAFHTPEERDEARAAYLAVVEGAPLRGKFAERKRRAPFLDPTPQLVPGDEVIFTDLGATEDIPQDLAAFRTPGERVVSHSPRRGGEKATAKAVRTRAQNKKKPGTGPIIDVSDVDTTSPDRVITPQRSSVASSAPSQEDEASAADRLAELMKQMQEEDRR